MTLLPDFTELLRYPGVVEEEALDQAGLQADALALLDATLAEFVAAREREGAKLAAVICRQGTYSNHRST